jgi:diacylglycerol O-acyltransferase
VPCTAYWLLAAQRERLSPEDRAMATAGYERLSALDAHFLELEDAGVHMHVAGVLVCDAAPLARADGGLDADRIRSFVGSRLSEIPRYRQRLAWIPLERHPVWVDDASFNLQYHVRHVALPRPGDERQLKRLVGLISSQKFDPSKPLWEMWVIEGVEDGRFAMLARCHHCMVDGIAGVGVLRVLLSPDPAPRERAAPRWRPRPAPDGAQLLTDSALRHARDPLALAGAALRALASPARALRDSRDILVGLGESFAAMSPAAATPINPAHVGPHRRIDWLRFELDELKRVRRRLGGTINDVVLATVTGAMRRYFHAHHAKLDGEFRAMCPVSVRAAGGEDTGGNRVVMLLVPLPLDEREPRRRLERITATTAALKGSLAPRGAELIEAVADHTTASLISRTMRLATRLRTFNLVVTNVPGPQVPLYLVGAPVLAAYPIVPLYENQALGIAMLSYAGGLFVGLTGDWDRSNDLHDVAHALGESFEELRKAAGD